MANGSELRRPSFFTLKDIESTFHIMVPCAELSTVGSAAKPIIVEDDSAKVPGPDKSNCSLEEASVEEQPAGSQDNNRPSSITIRKVTRPPACSGEKEPSHTEQDEVMEITIDSNQLSTTINESNQPKKKSESFALELKNIEPLHAEQDEVLAADPIDWNQRSTIINDSKQPKKKRESFQIVHKQMEPLHTEQDEVMADPIDSNQRSMRINESNQPKKKSELFHLVLKNMEPCPSRKEVFNCFERIAAELVVAKEKPRKDGPVFKVFMRSNKKIKASKIKRLASSLFEHRLPACGSKSKDSDLTFERCRKREDAIKSITKVDIRPRHKGVNTDLFAFHWRAIDWADKKIDNDEPFSFNDPLVAEFPYKHKQLKSMLKDRRLERTRAAWEPLKPVSTIDKETGDEYTGWRLKVATWWNSWVEALAYNGTDRAAYLHKKAQLYLFGEPHTGKTTFLRDVIFAGLTDEQIGSPVMDGRFGWQNIDSVTHRVVHIDEFDFKMVKNPRQWKQAVAGEPFSTDVKFEDSIRLQLVMPMVFVSNIDITKQKIKEKGVKERLLVVEATGTKFAPRSGVGMAEPSDSDEDEAPTDDEPEVVQRHRKRAKKSSKRSNKD